MLRLSLAISISAVLLAGCCARTVVAQLRDKVGRYRLLRRVCFCALGVLVALGAECPSSFDAARAEQGSEFNHSRYKRADLDELWGRTRPADGVDMYPALPLRVVARLHAYAEPCPTAFLKMSMQMIDLQPESVLVTKCVKVQSKKGRTAELFIQDAVAEFLPKEIPLGSPVTLFVVHMFTTPNTVGLLINDFSAAKQ